MISKSEVDEAMNWLNNVEHTYQEIHSYEKTGEKIGEDSEIVGEAMRKTGFKKGAREKKPLLFYPEKFLPLYRRSNRCLNK